MTQAIQFETDDQGIATLTLDLPNRPMNVVTTTFLDELAERIEQVAGSDDIRGAIVTSGKDAFMAGADLKALVQIYDRGVTAADIFPETKRYSDILRRLETCGKPFAAALNGTALGGGLELALACHYRVVADNPKLELGLPEVKVGLLPGAGGTQRLPRLIGIEAALQLITQGKSVPPAKAAEMGIVHDVVDSEAVYETAHDWLLGVADAEQPWDKKGFRFPGGVAGAMHPKSVQTFMVGAALVARETQHNYPAPIAILSSVYEGSIVPMDTALRIEAKYFASLLADPVARNMTRTLFIHKGAADKLVARPQGPDKLKVNKLGVLGAGMMGAGIAYVSARAGQQVILLDTDLEKAEQGKAYSEGLLQKRVERGKATVEQANVLLERIHPTTQFADLADCDLVIEAVFEHRDIKADVTGKTQAVCGPDTLFASNTSTLPITGLARAHSKPENFIGLHFFSPVDKMPLVEVILGEQTGEQALAHALDYVAQIRKTPIVVNDSRGFYTSRVFGTFANEGLTMLAEGINPALIENVAKQAGMPVGPLAVADEVTIELMYKVQEQTAADLGDQYVEPTSRPVVKHFVEVLDRKGKRYGKGFYEYPADKPKYLWPGLADHYPRAPEQPDPEEVRKRILYIQALETARCLEEEVLTRIEDGDIGSILGWGFPPYTGGTVSFIDTVGIADFVAECERLAAAYGERFAPSEWLQQRARQNQAFYPATDQPRSKNAA